MASARTIANLTEAWPEDDAENFELQAFAAAVRDGRPELSAPALDRIEATLAAELNRQTALPERKPSRWQQVRTTGWSIARLAVPYAAAASVMIVGGVWAIQQWSPSSGGVSAPAGVPVDSVPVRNERRPDDRPNEPHAPTPDPARNAPRGG